jgi:hypothetical protein
MGLTVTAPLVIVKDDAGHDLYLYENAPVPANADAGDVKRLKAEGMLGDAEQTAPGGEADGPPAKSAPKSDWVDYAVAQGADPDEADGSTKDQLIDTYGG